MGAQDPQEHLLFGVLALQSGFITQADLVAATSQWMMDKSRAISDILLEREALSREECDLLNALVAKHLQRHNGRAQDSLSTLAATGSICEALGRLPNADPDVAKSLCQLGGDVFATKALSIGGGRTQEGQRFQILRPHARGGLGQVYVARDDEVNHREVALKEILPAHADNENNRVRFLNEAEVTGGLEHPGIVPVYGLGQYTDGRPFYAMRFVRGKTMREAIEQFHGDQELQNDRARRSLELRQLLGQCVDVCHAMEYAHMRGVLHRDLKPDNIMVGEYGETLVVDWGLAKAGAQIESMAETIEAPLETTSGSSTHLTEMGRAVGTPEFMSPEQAAGRLDVLSERSDVFSLGATLFCVLTGKPAIDRSDKRDIGQMLRHVQEGRFRRLRDIRPDVPAPLEAICQKAMAVNPDDRYPSAGALGDDVERWLADERVLAWKEPLKVRVGRLMRRHQAWFNSLGAALLVGLVISSIYAVLIARANRRAQANFDLARDAVEAYFGQVSESVLLGQPGLQPLRRDLLQSALPFYEKLLSQQEADDTVEEDRAVNHYRLGVIKEQMNDADAALTHYRAARSVQEDTLGDEQHPQYASRVKRLSDTVNAMGRTWQMKSRAAQREENLKQARDAFEQAFQWRKKLVEIDPRNAEFLRLRANSQMNLGIVEQLLGQTASAQVHLDGAQEVRTDALQTQELADDWKLRRDRAKGHYNAARIELEKLSKAADRDAASAAFKTAWTELDSAIEIFQRLVDEAPEAELMDLRYHLALCYQLRGTACFARRDFYNTMSWQHMFRSTMQPLADQNPAITEYRHSVWEASFQIAVAQASLGDTDAASEAVAALLSELSQLKKLPPRLQKLRGQAEALQKKLAELSNPGETDETG